MRKHWLKWKKTVCLQEEIRFSSDSLLELDSGVRKKKNEFVKRQNLVGIDDLQRELFSILFTLSSHQSNIKYYYHL